MRRPMLFQTTNWPVVLSTGLGNIIEWYEFYLFGTLAAILGKHFLPPDQNSAGLLLALMVFGVGFLVRPVGALVFGRLGDRIGRKYTFLITILVMGLATLNVGLLPGYGSIGMAAPIILVLLRMLQGFALGGEYGGAVSYVAEHTNRKERGMQTAWIQLSATVGLFLALVVTTGTRWVLGEGAFEAWGWRIPFLLAFVLLLLSVWFRMSMTESPAFERLRQQGRLSEAPIAESLGQWRNLRKVIVALLGLVAGQAVVWYAGQFYVLFYLTNVLRVDAVTANVLVAIALLMASPFFLVFGSLSDKLGRKPVILVGLLLAAATYFPLFGALTEAGNPALAAAHRQVHVVVQAEPGDCSFQGNPLAGETDFNSSCDIAQRHLARQSVNYSMQAVPGLGRAVVQVGDQKFLAPEALVIHGRFTADSLKIVEEFKSAVTTALVHSGYPAQADPVRVNKTVVVLIVFVLVLYVAMVYGPIAAALVEMFPTRIRYTSVSLPYHLGNGWFGGMLPTIAFAMVAQSGNVHSGLWYPVVIAGFSFVFGLLFVREKHQPELDEVE